eukprot:7592242-Pyramimonas_sp.AAC.1
MERTIAERNQLVEEYTFQQAELRQHKIREESYKQFEHHQRHQLHLAEKLAYDAQRREHDKTLTYQQEISETHVMMEQAESTRRNQREYWEALKAQDAEMQQLKIIMEHQHHYQHEQAYETMRRQFVEARDQDTELLRCQQLEVQQLREHLQASERIQAFESAALRKGLHDVREEKVEAARQASMIAEALDARIHSELAELQQF